MVLDQNPVHEPDRQTASSQNMPARASLTSLLQDMQQFGSKTAIVDHQGLRRRPTSYAALATLADRFAAEIARLGLEPGERVLLWGANSAEWIAAFYGCMLRGVLAVPLDAAGAIGFAERVMHETTPSLLIGDHEHLSQLHSSLPRIILEDCASTLPAPNPDLPSTQIRPDTPVQIVFTSGTTSEPKGIVHSHRNILSSLMPIEREIARYRRYERWVHPLRFLNALPLSHVFGQFMSLWIPPLLGAEVHLDTRLEANHLMAVIRQERISLLATVPRVLELLRSALLEAYPILNQELKAAQGEPVWRRWWRFRKIHTQLGYKFWATICGGASLPPELESFWTTLGFAAIQGYGMTESSALITLNHPFRTRRGTIGKAMPGREIKLDADGEILVRGPMISSFTWQKGQLTQNASDWLATGDLAKQDEAGNFYFIGRKNQLLVTASGMNIHPEDLEAKLREQTGVIDCAVLARPARPESQGQEPAAILLFRGSPQEAQECILAANAQLADYQRIRYWRLWPGLDLPRTATGKVERRTLAAWLSADAESPTEQVRHTPHDDDPLLKLLLSVSPQAPSEPNDESRIEEDFGLDSLGRVQLEQKIESVLGRALPESCLLSISTLGELRHALGLFSEAGQVQSRSLQGNWPSAASSTVHPVPSTIREHGLASGKNIYPLWPRRWPARLMRRLFTGILLRPIVSLLARPHILFAEGLNDALSAHNEPLIVIVNHINNYDVPLALFALPAKLRYRMTIAMAADLLADWRARRGEDLWFPSFTGLPTYWLVTLLFNVFPLPRNADFIRSFEHAGRALDQGWNVMIYPEGHQTGGQLAAFRPGIGLLVAQTQAAVLPVALTGYGKANQVRSDQRKLRPNDVSICLGQPIHFSAGTSPSAITEHLHATMQTLIEKAKNSSSASG